MDTTIQTNALALSIEVVALRKANGILERAARRAEVAFVMLFLFNFVVFMAWIGVQVAKAGWLQ